MKFTKRMFSIIGAVALASMVAMQAPSQDAKPATAKVGEKAPDFKLMDLDGAEHSLKQHAGKIVVLQWVNPECPICKGAHDDGRVANMIKELEALGAVHIAVNTTSGTTAEENKEALKRYGIEYDLLLDKDGKVGRAYAAKTTPHLYVIDTEGVLRYNGAIDNVGGARVKEGQEVINYAVNAVKQLKAGETVEPNTTKPYGCTVKYPRGS